MSLPDEMASALRPLFIRRRLRLAVVGLFCLVAAVLAVASMRRESVTVDEPMNLVAGYTWWKFGDGRVEDSNGAMPQRWYALPLLLMQVRFPSRDTAAWHQPGYLGEDICLQFLFGSGNDADAMIFWGRVMALTFALAVVAAVYAWTARIFGRGPAVFAAFFAALSPTMLAHGHLMTLDTPAALFFLMSAGCFWLLLRRFTAGRLAASAGCFALLAVSKISCPLFVPMALAMFASRALLRRPWPVRFPGLRPFEIRGGNGLLGAAGVIAAAHALAAAVVIWCFYGWRFHYPGWDAARDGYTESFPAAMASLGTAAHAALAACERWRLLPEGYIYGFARTLRHAAERPAFLNGHYSSRGWWYYFPYCFLVKTAPAVLACAGLGLGYAFWRCWRRRGKDAARILAWLDRTSPLWSVIIVYGVAAMLTPLNIGLRHLLPLYPAVFSLAGAGLWWVAKRRRWGLAAAALVIALQIGTIARIHPFYLAYFNAFAGGPSDGYQHLTDSNVDWGQDLPSLADWLKEHHSPAEGAVYVNCFGFDSARRWGITAYKLPYDVTNPRFSSDDPVAFEPGLYCISASTLVLPGPAWTTEHERRYRLLLASMEQLAQTNPPNAADPENRRIWSDLIFKLASSQYGRLRGFLLHRKPDAMVGYSILIYRISDEELHRALLYK